MFSFAQRWNRALRGAADRAVRSVVRLMVRLMVRSVALALLGTALAAQAAPMPNALRKVSITAREQPIAAFLQDLFAAVDVPVAVSPNLAGSVNGVFTGSAEKVLRDVSRVYNLVSYYDGTLMHVVPANDVVRRSFAVAPAVSTRMLREAHELGLPDTRNTLRLSSDGNLLAVGTQRFVEQLDELVRAAAAAGTGGADFRVFYLRYAWAQDVTMTFANRQVVVPGVVSILRSLVGAGGGVQGNEVLLRPTAPGLRGQGLGGQGTQHQVSTAAAPRGSARGNGREEAADQLVNALSRTALPPELASGTVAPNGSQIRIEADPRLNAVIVRDLSERLPRYEQLIAALDVEPQSLEIEATIIDVNTDRARELGIDWRFTRKGYTFQVGDPDIPPPGVGGVASAVVGSVNQFIGRIKALESEGAARVVSSPQVVTLSNVEAIFDNSSTFFVRVAGREEVDLFPVSAGTLLRVTPHIFRDQDRSRIKLVVNVEDGALTNRQVDQIPVIDRSTINTQALILEGESLLIGGLVRDSNSSYVDKVPGLGNVPLIGNVFKSRGSASARIERMFLITPRISGGRAAAPSAAAPARPAPPSVQPQSLPPAAPPAGMQVSAPAARVPAMRPSVVLDLDAMQPAGPRPASTRPGSNRGDRVATSNVPGKP